MALAAAVVMRRRQWVRKWSRVLVAVAAAVVGLAGKGRRGGEATLADVPAPAGSEDRLRSHGEEVEKRAGTGVRRYGCPGCAYMGAV